MVQKRGLFVLNNALIEEFTIILLSILLEAFPFVILGAFISSMLHLFVHERVIARFIPKNKFLGLFAASLMGIIFPVCECAIIPVMRRLIRKGLPFYIAVTFMCAVPIVNPIVLLSTYYAFADKALIVQ
ncbi:MAG: permease [Candidatus Omnitrophica bacterium]|nr:permease [Candidatus Omnitrophota bacterium]